MARLTSFLILCFVLGAAVAASAQAGYLGFDKNTYPGDAALPALRKTFRFTGYYLNNPPGASSNSWTGKRAQLKQHGFGFLVLFNGREESALGQNPAALGTADGKAAALAATQAAPLKSLIKLRNMTFASIYGPVPSGLKGH